MALGLAAPRLRADSASQRQVDRRVDQLMRLISVIQAALDGLVIVLGPVVVVVPHVMVAAVVPIAIVWLLVKTAVPLLHRQLGRSRLTSVRIVPPVEGAYNSASWVALFRMLHAISAPWWRRALFGQAWLVFELEARQGHVIPRCWLPTQARSLVAAAIRSALPGANVAPIDDGPAPDRPPAARARLRLWRGDLFPLGASHPDAGATAVDAPPPAGHRV